MEHVTGYFHKAKQTLAVFLAVMLVCNTCLLPLVRAADNEAKEIDVVDTMTNYDPKLRIGKIILTNIQEDQAKGREVDWEKINKKVFRRSIMTHLVVDTGAEVAGMGLQYMLMGVAPPLGTAVGALLSNTLCGFAGATGYEMSEDIESGEKHSTTELFDRSLKRIDATNFAARTMGGMVGAVIGQAICPIPFLGAVIGSMAGGLIGGLLSNFLVKTDVGKSVGTEFQKLWNHGVDWIILQSNSRQAVLEDVRHRPGGKIAETRGIMKLREQLMSLHSRYLQLLSSSDFEAAERLKISEIQPLRTQLNPAIGSTP